MRLFKKEAEVKQSSIEELLGNDAVKSVLEDFINDHLEKAEGIVIIWAESGNVYGDIAGLSEAEASGVMSMIDHKLKHEGLPRE